MTQNLKLEHSQKEKSGNLNRRLNNRFIREKAFCYNYPICAFLYIVKLQYFYKYSTGENNIFILSNLKLNLTYCIIVHLYWNFFGKLKRTYIHFYRIILTTISFSHYTFSPNLSNLSFNIYHTQCHSLKINMKKITCSRYKHIQDISLFSLLFKVLGKEPIHLKLK